MNANEFVTLLEESILSRTRHGAIRINTGHNYMTFVSYLYEDDFEVRMDDRMIIFLDWIVASEHDEIMMGVFDEDHHQRIEVIVMDVHDWKVVA